MLGSVFVLLGLVGKGDGDLWLSSAQTAGRWFVVWFVLECVFVCVVRFVCVCLGDQADIGSVDSICRVVGRKRDRRMRKAKNNHRTDNEGGNDDGNDDDDNTNNNKASPSFPIPNRFLDGYVVGVTSMTTVIGEEIKHGPGDASVTVENYDDNDKDKEKEKGHHCDESNLLPPFAMTPSLCCLQFHQSVVLMDLVKDPFGWISMEYWWRRWSSDEKRSIPTRTTDKNKMQASYR